MKLDVFPHILPKRFFDRMLGVAPPTLHLQKRMRGIPVLVDLAENAKLREKWAAAARRVQGDRPIDMVWLSKCVGDLVDERTVVINEYDLDATQACFRTPGSYFNAPPAPAPPSSARPGAAPHRGRPGRLLL